MSSGLDDSHTSGIKVRTAPGWRLPPLAHRTAAIVAAGALALGVVAAGVVVAGTAGASSAGTRSPRAAAHTALRVCGRPILRSPYSYQGAAGPYVSGTSGLPTYGSPGTNFPSDTAGVVLPAGTHSYPSYLMVPDTVYYLVPGMHIGSIMADTGDVIVGGYHHGEASVMTGTYARSRPWAIDSNSTNGDQSGVTIEYLTVEKYQTKGNSAAINPDSNTDWTIKDNLIAFNVDGAGVMLGSGNVLRDNCLTLNGQYGFQAQDSNAWGRDALTRGPYGVTVADNEISYNDTCDYEGLLTNKAIGWKRHNPVPKAYRNSHCTPVKPDGDEGGFKLWRTNGVTIEGNDIHNNYGPGAWVDTDNANTTFVRNTIASNDGNAIIEEISYNFSIRDNYLARNALVDGPANPAFPEAAVYISESGSDTTFGGVPACSEQACASQPSYSSRSAVTGNTLVNNGGSVFLWQNSNRHCSDRSDHECTLVDHGPSGPFTISACRANLPSASVSTTDYVGNRTGSPQEDWWDGCMWRTENVRVARNLIEFNPRRIPHCNQRDWRDCGAGGIFAEYGSPPNNLGDWVIPTQLTFFQHDTWSDNTYKGPSKFYAWNQGNGVTWAEWTRPVSRGDKCQTSGDRKSGSCTGPFGQDAGSRYRK
jgi:parallel beta-helix repeat protein